MNKGFGAVSIVIALAVLLAAGGGAYYVKTQKVVEINEEQNATTTVASTSVSSKASAADVVKSETKKVEAVKAEVKPSANVSLGFSVEVKSPAMISTEIVDEKFDSFFKRWVAAWNTRDINSLVNTFGYEDFQVESKKDDPIWHYNSYDLYKSESNQSSAEEVKVRGYYIVLNSTGSYNIAIIHGYYSKTEDVAAITQWQVYPSVYEPEAYVSIQEAKVKIDKLISF